ncbi:MAG TPA: FHA domain-containing protein [Acidimicrobiia bacterium]|nr:FHA domain-containing protein [Acidimicrobiia bacterium]
MAVLEMTGPDGREIFELDGDRYTIGRSSANDIVVENDSSVSRRHALLERLGTMWYIKDLGSMNGIEVAGKRVLGEAPLHHTNEIIIGNTRVVFLDRAGSDGSETKPKAPTPKLTAKEKETLVELCRPRFEPTGTQFTQPATVRVIAGRMFVGEPAVKAHLSRLYDKFGIYEEEGLNRRLALANHAIQSGAITQTDYKDSDPTVE